MPQAFGDVTLGAFEDACASIPLRNIDRAFQRASIGLRECGAEDGGARRVRFRRYVASVDQGDEEGRHRLGSALGALIAEVAASKVEFLVTAAERDGYSFADGVFRPVNSTAPAFEIMRVEDFGTIDGYGRRLRLLAADRPNDAFAGAAALLESVCRTVVRRGGEADRVSSGGLVDLANATLDSLGIDNGVAALMRSLAQFCAATEPSDGSSLAATAAPARARARLAIGAAVAFAGFISETYAARDEPGTRRS